MKNRVSSSASSSGRHLLGPGREADQVGEEDRDRLRSAAALTAPVGARRRAMISSIDLRRVVALEPAADPLLFDDALVQARALDGDRREVGERRQQVEVLLREGPDVERRVDVDDADDRVAVPERRAHGRADLLHADRHARARSARRSGRPRSAPRPSAAPPCPRSCASRARSRRRSSAVPRLEPADPQLRARPASSSSRKPRSTGRYSKIRSMTFAEHRLDVVGGDQRLGDLHEDLEDLVLVGDVERRRAFGSRVDSGDGRRRPSRGRSRG